MASASEETRKALGVGIFYVLGGLLAIVGWPAIVPSVLLGSGAALMVYHFLGGIDAEDRMNLTLTQKVAIQVGGASVILLTFSAGIWYGLREWSKDSISSDPDFENVIIIDRNGRPVKRLSIKRGEADVASLSWPRRNSPRTLGGNELQLDLDPGRKRIRVTPLADSSTVDGNPSPFSYGYIGSDYSNSPLVTLVRQMMQEDFFNPSMVQIRDFICGGVSCPVSMIGFPIAVSTASHAGLASDAVNRGRIRLCFQKHDYSVGDVLRPATPGTNASLVIQALALAPSVHAPDRRFHTLAIDRVDTIEGNPSCQRIRGSTEVLGVIHADDLRRILPARKPQEVPILFATVSATVSGARP